MFALSVLIINKRRSVEVSFLSDLMDLVTIFAIFFKGNGTYHVEVLS